MTEQKIGFNPSHLVPMGLFRDGVHHDTEIMAKSPNGEDVLVRVQPFHVLTGGTIFAPVPDQQEALSKLFPPKRHSI